MTAAAAATLALLVASSAAFATGRWRPDAVAVLTLLALLLTRVVDLPTGLAGFGSPVLLAIGAVFVLSAGLERTGIASGLGRRILRLAGRSETRLILAFCIAAGLLAGVMNSIGAMAVLLPAAVAAARQAKVSPSRLLLPLALGTRLGGNLTLISGPSNLIASETLVAHGVRPLALLELLPLGTTFLIVGIAFLAAVGRRWLPDVPMHEPPRREHLVDLYQLHERLFEVRVPDGSPLAGKTIAQSGLGRTLGLTILSITRGARRIVAPPPDQPIRAGDLLVVQGRPEDLQRTTGLQPVDATGPHDTASARTIESQDIRVAEVTLAPRSALVGKNLRDIGFREKYGMTVLAIWREGRPRRTGLVDMTLQLGDALLVQGQRDRIRLLQREPDFLVLDPDSAVPPRRDRAAWAILGVAVMVAASIAGMPIAVATLLAAVMVVLAGCVRADEVYQAIDWRALVFIGAVLPLGSALSSTGAASALVNGALGAVGRTPVPALATVLVASVIFNQFMPSIAAAAVLAPIAMQAAAAVGASPLAFVMAVVAGTGTTFTPIGNPVNLLVMGPGGYQIRDYVRVGLPLAVLLTLASFALLPAVWPLHSR